MESSLCLCSLLVGSIMVAVAVVKFNSHWVLNGLNNIGWG